MRSLTGPIAVAMLVFLVALICAPRGFAGVTERVSVSTSGVLGNYISDYASISADGRYVAFLSEASNLVPGDIRNHSDVFVRDRLLGTTERVSISSNADEANANSYRPYISADGRFVAFSSQAWNLVSADSNGCDDAFVRDRVLGTTELVSVSSNEQQADTDSYVCSISGDGRFICFSSRATSLVPDDTNGYNDIFVRDRMLGTTERVSVSSSGEQGNLHSYSGSISADGRLVAFDSWAGNLAPDDSNGWKDLFVRDRLLGTTECVSISSSGEQGNEHSGGVHSVSSDGRYVAFESTASNLVPGDTNKRMDVFARDRLLGTTERASISSSGEQGNNESGRYGLSISADGRYVAFMSDASNMVPGDTNGYSDTFLRDRVLGTTERVSISSSAEQGNYESPGGSVSADGRYVAFHSRASNLVPGETNPWVGVFVRDRWGISDTKALKNGAAVVASAQTATASFPDSFYIEDADRSCAIRVAWQGSIVEGNRYRVDGTLATDENSGEQYINATNVRLVDALAVEPMGLRGMSLGGGDRIGQAGVTGGFGLNNIALLVRTWGKVTQVGDGYLYIDDGSGLKDGTTTGEDENVGLRVVCDPTEYQSGDYLLVTGLSSCFETPSGQIARRILTRRGEDVVKAQP